MKQLIEQIQQSIYGPQFYRTLLAAPLGPSFKYFAKFILFLAVVLTVLTSIPIIPRIPSLLRDIARGVVESFPADLELRITGGIVETNVSEPYVLPYPAIFRNNTSELPTAHLAVIDTQTPFSVEAFSSSSALLWVGHNFVAFLDEYGGARFQKIHPETHLLLNRSTMHQFVSAASDYFVYIPPLLVLLFFFGFIFLGYIQLIYLLFAALLVWLLLFAIGVRTSYGGAYRVGIHGVTLPLLLYGILIILGLEQATTIPLLFTCILLMVIYMNFRVTTPQGSSPVVSDHTAPPS